MNTNLEWIPVCWNGVVLISIFLSVLALELWWKNREQCLLAFCSRLLLGECLIFIFAITVSPVYGYTFPYRSGAVNLNPLVVLDSIEVNPLNFVGNIVMFIPVGILITIINRKYWNLRYVFVGTVVSIIIEGLQLFNCRGTDIDDVILNSIGYVIGWMIGCICVHSSTDLRRKICREQTARGTNPIVRFYGFGSILVIALVIVMQTGIRDLEAQEFDSVYLYDTLVYETESSEVVEVPELVENIEILGTPQLQAKNAIVVNIDSNKILWEQNAHTSVAPASCTKLLTALVALDYCDEEEVIRVGDELAYVASDATRSYIYRGCELTVEQTLISLLLPSGNDAAYALAAYTGRKIAGDWGMNTEAAIALFVDKMNQKAKEIGASESHFTTPDGYDSVGQYTTAHDLAMIGIKASQNETIARIANMPYARVVWVSGELAEYNNTNEQLLASSQYYNPNCKGLKTGTTDKAGACLVSLYEIGDKQYMVVLTGSTRQKRFSDAEAIYQEIVKVN